MGVETTKIEAISLPIKQIKSHLPLQPHKFWYPFRKYKTQKVQIAHQRLTTIINIQQPHQQTITTAQQYFSDLQDAFEVKTKNMQIVTILEDEQNYDVKTYIGTDGQKNLTLHLRSFVKFNTYLFNNLQYELSLNQQISSLKCKYLNCMIDKYVIQTGLQIQGQQNPNTQVFVLQPIATNLSQIIKYRRQNNWEWNINEFNALVFHLCSALNILHKNKIAHNNIRPCNVFYSLQKNCYQLGVFNNSLRKDNGDAIGLGVKISPFYEPSQIQDGKKFSLEKGDIYSLGMTLLCAFYLCEQIDAKKVQEFNKKNIAKYPILKIISEMLTPKQSISKIIAILPQGQISKRMHSFIQSLQYKNSPKEQKLIMKKKNISQCYQRLGLWNQWKDHHEEAYELEQGELSEFKKANSIAQLAKIQSCRGDIQAADRHAREASKMYRNLGYSVYEGGNASESLHFFEKAVECSKYFDMINDMENARNLQGLSLAHAEKGDYEVSKPLIKEAIMIVQKNMGKESIDFCKIKMSQAKVQCDFGQFQEAQKILQQCLLIAQKKLKEEQQSGKKLKAQILQQLGRNCMLNSSDHPQKQYDLIARSEKYLNQSISLNEDIPKNKLSLAGSIETLGELQLRKQNYLLGKRNFQKAQKLRQLHSEEGRGSHHSVLKQKAQTLCNLAACENGLGNMEQSINNYNDGLILYRELYGSDHNKYSAMAIGNMSKVYYKMGNKDKAKDCLKLATTILQNVLGNEDPDYLYFKNLQETI